jgi:hypothetical protein
MPKPKMNNDDMIYSQTYLEKKKLIEMQMEADLSKHNMKMEELQTEKENSKLFHEREMERIRVKSAEIRKQQERKGDFGFMNNYSRDLQQKGGENQN